MGKTRLPLSETNQASNRGQKYLKKRTEDI